MTIFDDYKKDKSSPSISPSLLWEYDLSHFDWWKSRKIVVQRVIERGWLTDFYAAFCRYCFSLYALFFLFNAEIV